LPGLLLGLERACQPERPGQDGTGSKGIAQEWGGKDLVQDVAAASKSAGPPGPAPTSGTRHPVGKAAISASSRTAGKYLLAVAGAAARSQQARRPDPAAGRRARCRNSEQLALPRLGERDAQPDA
jgi:hypothetical protein